METIAVRRHRLAVKKLENIRERALGLIKRRLGRITEFDVAQFVFAEFKKRGLVADIAYDYQIIAVDENSADPHYEPKKESAKIIQKGSLIKFDTWARLQKPNSYFGDVTWMFFVGRQIPSAIKKAFSDVAAARDLTLKFIKHELKKKKIPSGREVDAIVRNYFAQKGVLEFFTHNTGHSLGFDACHGQAFGLSPRSKENIIPEIPFTIEPGLYSPGKFGVRSEIDCYITKKYKLIVTSRVQRKITLI